MTSPSQPQPYAYVFQPLHPNIPWPKVEQPKPLAELHAKYWGIPIEGNEPELQTSSEGQPMDDDEDQSEVGPGCFALDLGIRGMRTRRLWVRKDYIRIYERCNTHYNNVLSHSEPGWLPPRAPSVVITGQPGIGKSFWIYYAVRRRLGERNPFLWYFLNKWRLFVHCGVFTCPGDIKDDYFKQDIWAFVDADNTTDSNSLLLTEREQTLFAILTTSPKPARWKLLKKNTSCIILTMNPWSWEEICQAVIIHKLRPEQLQLEDVRYIYDEFGPIPRLCIDCVRDPASDELTSYKQRRDQEISKLSLDYLLKLAERGGEPNLDVSHSVFLVRRENVDNLQNYIVEPITPSVGRLLHIKLMEEGWTRRIQAYNDLATVPQNRDMAGRIFESMAQRQLQKEVALDLVPMKRQPASGNTNAKWMCRHNKVAVSSSTAPNAGEAANTPTPIKFKTNDVSGYDKLADLEIHSDVFYVPNSPKQDGFDSFILHDQILFIFQMTIASKHPIRPGIMDSLSHETLKEAQWRLVFVLPPGETIECPESKDEKLKEFWERVTPPFTAEFDPGKYTGTEIEDQTTAQPPATHRQGRARDDNEDVETPSTDAPAGPSTSTRSAQKRKAQVVSPEQGPASPSPRGRQRGKQRAKK